MNVSGPIPRTYRVGEWPLFAGAYPGSDDEAGAEAKVAAICAAGVDLCFDLTEFGELEPYAHLLPDGVEHWRFPIRDFTVPRPGYAAQILDEMTSALAGGKTVYVHCWGGRGRTGTLVGCWLVRHGLSGRAALDTIARRRQDLPDGDLPSPETEEQRDLVLRWEPGT